MNESTQQRIVQRLLWMQEDIQALKTIILMDDIIPNDKQPQVLARVNEHIANIESHLHNCRRMLPALPEPGLPDLIEAGKQERKDAERAKAFMQWLHAATEEASR